MLVELKAVDGAWPMVGQAVLAPVQPVSEALGDQDGLYGAAAEPLVLDRLGLHAGDKVRIGNESFVLRGRLDAEPDRVASPSIIGPRALISIGGAAGDWPDAARHDRRIPSARRGAARHSPAALAAALRENFPDTGWRIRDTANAAPGVAQFIDQTSLFMTLVGLTSLLVGGIGVANGVRAWLEARAEASPRCAASAPRRGWCFRCA